MWVYLDTRSSGNCVCVEVQPNMTALEMTHCVIKESKRIDGDSEPSQQLYLHEVILGGMMERPIHHSEIMLEVTLKWGEWSEPDRRDNYLLLKPNMFYDEALPCALPPMSVFGEAYFSDNKPGKASFKKHQVSFKLSFRVSKFLTAEASDLTHCHLLNLFLLHISVLIIM